jgi:hypothetical protein
MPFITLFAPASSKPFISSKLNFRLLSNAIRGLDWTRSDAKSGFYSISVSIPSLHPIPNRSE